MMLIRAFIKLANRPQRRDSPTAQICAVCCRCASSLHALHCSTWRLMSCPWSVRRRASRHRCFQVLQQICCCSPLLRLQVRRSMRILSLFIRVRNKLILCFCVSRIAVCRCLAALQSTNRKADILWQACLRALRPSARQSEAHYKVWYRKEVPSSVQGFEAPCRRATRVCHHSIPQSAAFW